MYSAEDVPHGLMSGSDGRGSRCVRRWLTWHVLSLRITYFLLYTVFSGAASAFVVIKSNWLKIGSVSIMPTQSPVFLGAKFESMFFFGQSIEEMVTTFESR